jgi:2-oxo-4-hydroxy-4-carboxy-5-ureidoimidazoline decarboxylase
MIRIEDFNEIAVDEACDALAACCGCRAWAARMVELRPFTSLDSLYAAADRIWLTLAKEDWIEAFSHHPRIGDLASLRDKWTRQEQSGVSGSTDAILMALASGNREYERKFGHVFLVCASGKSAEEMLEILRTRMPNSPEAELRVAADEQAKITRLRLKRLFDDER